MRKSRNLVLWIRKMDAQARLVDPSGVGVHEFLKTIVVPKYLVRYGPAWLWYKFEKYAPFIARHRRWSFSSKPVTFDGTDDGMTMGDQNG